MMPQFFSIRCGKKCACTFLLIMMSQSTLPFDFISANVFTFNYNLYFCFLNIFHIKVSCSYTYTINIKMFVFLKLFCLNINFLIKHCKCSFCLYPYIIKLLCHSVQYYIIYMVDIDLFLWLLSIGVIDACVLMCWLQNRG